MRPAPLLVVAFVAWTALGVATSFGWLPSHAWPLAGVAVAAAALLDLLRLRRRATPEVVREMPEALPIGIEREVTLHIESGPRRQCVDVFDLHPGGWESTGLPRSLRLPPDTVSSRSEEHTSELQSLMRISYAVFCLQKKNKQQKT